MDGEQLRALVRKPHKYRAEPVVIEGLRFGSRKEGERWQTLRYAEGAGLIRNLRRQVRFPLCVGPVRIGFYVADFVYEQGGAEVVEDCKGMRLPLYTWKKKHFEAQYQREIRET